MGMDGATVVVAAAAGAAGYAGGLLSSRMFGWPAAGSSVADGSPVADKENAVPTMTAAQKKKAKKAKKAGSAEGEGDVKKGAALFKTKCATCHSCTPGGPTMQGPNLFGIMGSKAAQSKGFKFTDKIKKADITWDNKTMFDWLASPKAMVKGTTMAFQGFKKEQDRNDVIAYLNTIK